MRQNSARSRSRRGRFPRQHHRLQFGPHSKTRRALRKDSAQSESSGHIETENQAQNAVKPNIISANPFTTVKDQPAFQGFFSGLLDGVTGRAGPQARRDLAPDVGGRHAVFRREGGCGGMTQETSTQANSTQGN